MISTRTFGNILSAAMLWLGAVATSHAAREADATAEITHQLQDFLKYNTDASQHARFWAEDLVYTSAAGVVKHRGEIMSGFQSKEHPSGAAPEVPSVYTAEDILVRQYGDSAALTFRLVALKPDGTRLTYRNSGMFVRREKRWQAVTWQATKEPGN